MSSVANLFNAVNKAVLSECSYRVDRIEGLYLEIIALFEAIQLLDPIEERIKQIENQTRNIRYNFEHESSKAIAECNRDIFNIEEEMKEIKRKVDGLKRDAQQKDEADDERIKKLEKEMSEMNTSLNEKVIVAEIGDLDEKIKRLEQRVIMLESKPCQIPEVLIKSLEYTMDEKIKKNNEELDNIITNTITTAIQGILQDKESKIFKQIVEAVKEAL
jgi:hypothetical protein